MAAKFLASAWLGFLIGVGIGSWYSLDRALISILISVILVMVVSGIVMRRTIFVIFIVCGCVLGLWHVERSFLASEYQSMFGQNIDAEGTIVVDPPRVDRNQQITILPDGKTQSLRASLFQPINAHRGDRVWIRGTLQPPENFEDFDYIGYLQRYNIYGVLKKPKVIVLRRSSANWRTPLTKTKDWLLNESKKKFPEKPGSLIVGMLIGEKGGVTKDISEDFSRTGLSHVIAVSGFNMTVIAAVCVSLAWYLGRRVTNYFTVLIILSFVVITGATASVVRAAIMALLVVSAQLLGRLYTSGYALLWAAGLMVLFNPRILAWDVGFQLSMLATLGILTIYSQQSFKSSALKTILYPTLGAIVMTVPLIAFYFQTVSLIAPLANMLLLPLVPWIMFFGTISFLPLIGTGLSQIATALANIFLSAVHFLASFTYSSIPISISPLFILIYYFAVIILFLFWRRKSQL